MQYSLVVVALAAEAVMAFPFVANMPGVDSSLLNLKNARSNYDAKRQTPGPPAAICPNNPNPHVPAPGITAEYPYNNAANGLPGNGVGGYQVPAPGDTAHE
jgi:hypothetical protein